MKERSKEKSEMQTTSFICDIKKNNDGLKGKTTAYLSHFMS